jgi:hypothetical protein
MINNLTILIIGGPFFYSIGGMVEWKNFFVTI